MPAPIGFTTGRPCVSRVRAFRINPPNAWSVPRALDSTSLYQIASVSFRRPLNGFLPPSGCLPSLVYEGLSGPPCTPTSSPSLIGIAQISSGTTFVYLVLFLRERGLLPSIPCPSPVFTHPKPNSLFNSSHSTTMKTSTLVLLSGLCSTALAVCKTSVTTGAAAYQQCGGKGFSGPTTCTSGLKCYCQSECEHPYPLTPSRLTLATLSTNSTDLLS